MFNRHSVVYEREGGTGFGIATKRPVRRSGRAIVREYTVLLHRNEGGARGYWVDFPGVPGIVTGGDTIAQTLRRARAALSVHLEWLLEDGEPLPEDRASKQRAASKPAVTQKIRVKLAHP